MKQPHLTPLPPARNEYPNTGVLLLPRKSTLFEVWTAGGEFQFMTDLFNIPETPSPRLAWLKKNQIQTSGNPDAEIGKNSWAAWIGDLKEAIKHKACYSGKTKDEALTNLAKSLNIPLWNEEGFKR